MKYRAIERQNATEGEYVILQRKERWYEQWQYFGQAKDLAEADTIIKGVSSGTITTGIWDYDKAGNRLNYDWL